VLLAIILLVRSGVTKTLIGLAVSAGFGLLSPVVLSSLKGYQRSRIMSFLAPWFDPHGISWNAIQSQIAIGSGRLIGKGFLHGSQKRLGFLPNRHTDFVFSSLGEEFGLIGCLVLLGLFLCSCAGCYLPPAIPETRPARCSASGCAIIGYQMFVNIGMLLGILPSPASPCRSSATEAPRCSSTSSWSASSSTSSPVPNEESAELRRCRR